MNLQKLNPWNWFKHEEGAQPSEDQIPLSRDEYAQKSPQSPGSPLLREVDRLLEETLRGVGLPSLFSRVSRPTGRAFSTMFFPQVDVASDNEQYTVTLEAAGLTESDLKIDIHERRLMISGEKRDEKTEEDKRYYRIERSYGRFQRVLDLPNDANEEEINASMRHGVLKIIIPRIPEKAGGGKTIPIDKG